MLFRSGVAFSPNSKVLYVSSFKNVWQFDLTATNIPASQSTVAIYDGFRPNGLSSEFHLSQLAPDGKIYINTVDASKYLHVIDYPDSIGIGCHVCQHCIQLPTFYRNTIANHPNYFLGAVSGSICDSLISVNNLQMADGNTLKLFPNPVSGNGEVTFNYPSTGAHSVIVINDMEGKEVLRYLLPQWSSVQHIKLPKLSGGIYMARLISNNSEADVKFLVE